MLRFLSYPSGPPREVRGGSFCLRSQVPSSPQPNSKPAILTPTDSRCDQSLWYLLCTVIIYALYCKDEETVVLRGARGDFWAVSGI